MKPLRYSLIVAALACGFAQAQTTAYTTPVGYVTQTCLANSDTVVGVPLRASAAAAGALASAADTTTVPESAVVTLSGTPGFVVDGFAGTYYAKFKSGAAAGYWFPVTANTANSLTLDLNGAALPVTVVGDSVEVVKFWTLNELFVPADSTTDPATTNNAIVASTSVLPGGRRTEVLLPNLTGLGINLAPSSNYYIFGGVWRKVGDAIDHGTDQLWPDTYFIIRNPAAVVTNTSYTIAGEVDTTPFTVFLSTQGAAKQDNFVALPRPVDVTLSQLGLAGTSAFMESTNALPTGRRDEVLVYDNAVAARNKAPSSNYYYLGGVWRKQGDAVDHGTDLLPVGATVVIRKYQSGTGASSVWTNTPNY